MNIYKATLDDINNLIQLRIDFLKMNKGFLSSEDEEIIRKQLYNYFEKHIPLGDFIAMIGELDNKIVATAFLILQERPANSSFITGLTATLLNVMTYPEFRRKGIAMKVIQALIEDAKSLGVSSIDLSSTENGKELYKKLGFVEPAYTAMRLKL